MKNRKRELNLCAATSGSAKKPRLSPGFYWQVGIFTGPTPLHLDPPAGFPNPIITASEIRDVNAEAVADPFMLRVGDQWHLFCEIINHDTSFGEIGHASSYDGFDWQYQGTVLREPYHMSYPYAFEWNGAHYLIPETLTPKEVRLYCARDFPTGWEHIHTMLAGEFADASIVAFGGKWWLFACSTWKSSDSLRLFHAESPLGEWSEHPRSPLIEGDSQRARPAGRVIHWGGGLLRFAQVCEPSYGVRVRAFHVTRLTTDAYEEREVDESPILKEGAEAWCSLGMHHLDPHLLSDGSWIACVDGRRQAPDGHCISPSTGNSNGKTRAKSPLP